MISGKYRNSSLKQPNLKVTRSTTDRVKEAVFSMLQFQIKNTIVLDAFAGSGSLGIECVSRGATKVFCIEKNKEAIKVIQENVKNLKINNLQIIQSDITNYLFKMKNMKFDLIFLDPPYKEIDLCNKTLKIIEEMQILKKFGLIIVECLNWKDIVIPKSFVIQKTKKYGSTNILVVSNNI